MRYCFVLARAQYPKGCLRIAKVCYMDNSICGESGEGGGGSIIWGRGNNAESIFIHLPAPEYATILSRVGWNLLVHSPGPDSRVATDLGTFLVHTFTV